MTHSHRTPPRALFASSRSLSGALCVLAGAAAVAGILVATVAGPRPAAGAPGTPNTPQAPKTLYTENFENAPKTGAPQSLAAYSSASTQAPGQQYTADDDWLDRSYCNGLLVSAGNTPGQTDCAEQGQGPTVFNTLKAITSAMGTINGTGAANTAIAAYTENTRAYAGNQVEFATVDQLALPAADGRFLTFSVNAAAANCNRGATDPKLRFFFKSSDGTLTPVSSAPIDPCDGDPIGVDPAGFPIYGGQFPANGSLLAGSSVGIVMRNENGSGFGNDGAFDDITVLDGTPQLDKNFSPATIVAGATSTLTFTVTNTSDLAAKAGWSFADQLPADVTATGTNSTTCSGATVTAAQGSTSVQGTGDLTAGQESCTVSVEVTSDVVGTYTNTGCTDTDGSTVPGCTSNVTTTGLDRPGASTLTVGPAGPTSTTPTPTPSTTDPTTDPTPTPTVTTTDPTPTPTITTTDPTPTPTITTTDPTPTPTITTTDPTPTPTITTTDPTPTPTITTTDPTPTPTITTTDPTPTPTITTTDPTPTPTVTTTDPTPTPTVTTTEPTPTAGGSDTGAAGTSAATTGGAGIDAAGTASGTGATDAGTTAETGQPRLPWEIGTGSVLLLLGGLVLLIARRRRAG